MGYPDVRADFELLESLAEVTDMVVIDAEVWSLMRNPTKKRATELYLTSIRLWFAEHGDKPEWYNASDVQEIAERHDI